MGAERTVVVGTAGHIDHGKTTLLRALTGIDADRLPEERRRGMTIEVGYAHLGLPDGRELDFVDVPGHDRLVGNMLVGAGEIDAALLVVAADDGPRAQTLEHLELLDALGVGLGVVALTKIDAVAERGRLDEVETRIAALLEGTLLAGVPIVRVSSVTGEERPLEEGGDPRLDALREALTELRDRVLGASPAQGGARLAVDRVFTVRGRGTVVTGTLRGASLRTGATLRLLPSGTELRVRGLQVHGGAVEESPAGGRVPRTRERPRGRARRRRHESAARRAPPARRARGGRGRGSLAALRRGHPPAPPRDRGGRRSRPPRPP